MKKRKKKIFQDKYINQFIKGTFSDIKEAYIELRNCVYDISTILDFKLIEKIISLPLVVMSLAVLFIIEIPIFIIANLYILIERKFI